MNKKAGFTRAVAILVALLLSVGLLGGCGSSGKSEPEKAAAPESNKTTATEQKKDATPDAEKIKIIFTTASLPDVSYTKVLYDVVKPELEKLSNGKIELEIHNSGSLFSQDEELPATIKGNATMSYTDATWLADYMPSMNMLTAGYMFKDMNHMDKVLNGEIGEKIFNDVAEQVGVRPLGAYYIGARVVALRAEKDVITPDDLKGVKLRMPNSEAWLFLGKALGTNPIPVAFDELYTALQSGTVDGLENPIAGLEEGKFYEVTKSISLTNHMIGAVWPCINEKFWQGLTPELQQNVRDAFRKGLEANNKMAVEDEVTLLKKYQDMGLRVVNPDLNAFKKQVNDYYLGDADVVSTWDMDLFEQIKELGN